MVTRGSGALGEVEEGSASPLVRYDKVVLQAISRRNLRFYLSILEHESQQEIAMKYFTNFYP